MRKNRLTKNIAVLGNFDEDQKSKNTKTEKLKTAQQEYYFDLDEDVETIVFELMPINTMLNDFQGESARSDWIKTIMKKFITI